MKKIKIQYGYDLAAYRILNGTSSSYLDIQFFSWHTSPQGYTYWEKKYMSAFRKLQGRGVWDDILTEEDYGYFRAGTRDRRKFKDKFLTSKENTEYVQFAEGLKE